MILVVVTEPTLEPVTIAEAKTQCRIDIDDDDLAIGGFITAARQQCELVSRRAFVATTFDLYLDAWPVDGMIQLPRPPLSSVTGVYYTDESGVEATFAASNYVVDAAGEPGRVALKSGASWPAATLQIVNGVRVRFVAGYGATATAVPRRYRQAVLLLVGHWYENREAVLVAQGIAIAELPLGVTSLLMTDRGGWF